MTLSRRTLLQAGATLPFLASAGRAVAQSSGVLRIGLSSYPPNLLPWTQAGTAANTFKLMTMRGLLAYATDGSLRGELAESWERKGDTGWTFKLRAATFHNGKAVSADDVKWTIEQVAAPRSTAFLRTAMQGIDHIEIPDTRTITLVMKEPTAIVPHWMAAPFMPIVAAESIGPDGQGITAGPFVLKEAERGVRLEMEAFTGYYRPGLPKAKQLHVVAYMDDSLRIAALRAGDVDLIEYVPWSDMQSIESDPRLKMSGTNGPWMSLLFNGARGPFASPLARRAVALAVKREDVVASAFFGRGAPLRGLPIPEGSDYYDARYANAWQYDPAQAQALLAQAGVAPGTSVTLLAPNAFQMQRSTVEIVQRDLAAVGLIVQFNLQPDLGNFIQLATRGQYDLALLGNVADNPDPDGLASLLDGSLPPAFSRSYSMRNDRLTELLAQGRKVFDTIERKAIYAEVQRIVAEEVPVAMLCYRYQAYALRKPIEGFASLPGQVSFYSGINIETTIPA